MRRGVERLSDIFGNSFADVVKFIKVKSEIFITVADYASSGSVIVESESGCYAIVLTIDGDVVLIWIDNNLVAIVIGIADSLI